MDDYLVQLRGLFDRFSGVVSGVRKAATVSMVAASLGGVLTLAGVVRAGAPWWLGLILGLGVASPLVVLWRFRSALSSALQLPQRITSLPGDAHELVGDLTGMAKSLTGVSDTPKSPVAVMSGAKAVRSVVNQLRETNAGELIGGVGVLHPAVLLAGAGACAAGLFSLLFGAVVFLIIGALG